MRTAVALVCLGLLAACGRETPTTSSTPDASIEPGSVPQAAASVSIEPLPALFSGVLPCADCPGIRYEIDLRANNIYFLRMTYLDAAPERRYEDIGTWSIASDLHTLALRGSRLAPLLFSISSSTSLRKLDSEGQPIESELNYTLTRSEPYAALTPEVPLRGTYSLIDGQAVVKECKTGLELRLEGEGAAKLAEQFASLKEEKKHSPLVAAEGRIEAPPDASEAKLVLTSTARFWPDESCTMRGVAHELEGSRWVLVQLGDEPVVVGAGRPEPYIVLQNSTKEIAGHTGCNRLNGGYRIDGNKLQLSEVTTTRMACPEADIEHRFLNALEAVTRWRLEGDRLVLLDRENAPLMQLEARNL
ncbi:MAG TPA: META domain-containing protein [Steroidobacteraceae bacterium]